MIEGSGPVALTNGPDPDQDPGGPKHTELTGGGGGGGAPQKIILQRGKG